jgi:hypothetical protein
MAQVKLVKLNTTTQLPQEMDTSADDITLLSYTVTGGGAVLDGTGLDMNDTAISDAASMAFNDPSTDGIVNTAGTIAADDLMAIDIENSMTTAGAVLFPVVTDTADQVDAFRVPALAGVPTATPSDGGEGYLVWDSTGDALYAWDGSAWDNLAIVDEAERVCNSYTADETLLIADAVYISAADNVSKANAGADATAEVIGFAQAAATDTNPVVVCTEGLMGGFTGLTATDRYYLDDTAGLIVNSPPTGTGNNIIQVGYAKSTTELQIQIQYLGKKA